MEKTVNDEISYNDANEITARASTLNVPSECSKNKTLSNLLNVAFRFSIEISFTLGMSPNSSGRASHIDQAKMNLIRESTLITRLLVHQLD